MLPLTWYICTAQKLIFKKCVLDFSHAYGVWEMHICIEIIFSELNFRVCQIYKYHYCKDIFLEIDFWHSLFQFHFSHLCHQHSFGLVFFNAFVFSVHVLEIKLFHCLVQMVLEKAWKWNEAAEVLLFKRHPFGLRCVARRTYWAPFSSSSSKHKYIAGFFCVMLSLYWKRKFSIFKPPVHL